ncbi:MAG: deoxyhypusine synthase family protein [Thermoanaerobaculales bacterium]|jgi:deoxyhypusine synthase|nr:deoxyhypusine synthase family protein [Thermoanaerobaculales bacterium]
MDKNRRNDVLDQLGRAREVAPAAITGGERADELLQKAFPAFVGRQVRTAFELMARSIDEGATVFATLSGAMTPAGIHQSCLIPMIRAGMIDVLTTTGANLYHDAHRVIGHRVREIRPEAGDALLREARIIRIYDLGFEEKVLFDTDALFSRLLAEPEFQRPMTTVETNRLLGKRLHELELELGVEEPCLLSTCYQTGVPVFVGAPQDGSIFLNAVRLKALAGDRFAYALDAIADVYLMAALQWAAQTSGETAVWIFGGGVPKNYTLQGEPTLSQMLELDARGFDIDVQICVDPVDNGALSSCPAGEGHTWGKVSAECVETSSVYVHTDVTAVLPWITSALLAGGRRRAPKALLGRVADAVSALDRAVAEHRERITAGLGFDPAAATNGG